MFVVGGQLLTTDAPYRIFPRVTYENIQKSLGFRNYRHISHYLKERNIEEEGVRDSFFDMQAGHARSTALLIYGRTSDNLNNLPADFFTNFFRASFRWQELLEIKDNSSGGFIIETSKPQNKIDQLLEKADEIKTMQQRLAVWKAKEVQTQAQTETQDGDTYGNTDVVEKETRRGEGKQCQELDLNLNTNQAAVAVVPRTRTTTETGTGTGTEEQQIQSNPSLYASPSPSMCPSQSTIRLCVYALSKFYGKPSKFRSMEQLQSVYFSYLKRVNLISVLATGSGKSLSFLLPAFIEKQKRTGLITVVLVPLISLWQDMARRANEAKTLVCSNDWKVYKRTPPDSYNLPDMFILSYDSALTNEALCFFESLAANGRLARIVIDEAHSLLTDGGWRHVLWKASRLSGIAAPIILLSATFPRELEARASETFCTHFQGIKTLTARKNIHYLLKQLDKEQFLSDLRDLMIRAGVFEGNGRAILFCRTKKNVEELQVKINSAERIETCAVSYTGDMAEEERHTCFNMFTDLESNNNRIMVATKAFGLGIDYPEVRLVIHYGSPSTSMDFAPETGRAGRDGKFSIASMFYSKYEVSTSAYIDVRMKNFVEDKSMCVRSFLASEMDDQCSGCDFLPDYVVCSRCNPGLLDEREKETEKELLSVEKDKVKDKDKDKDKETLTPTRKKNLASGSPPTPQSACSSDALSADSKLMNCTITKDNEESGVVMVESPQ
ncbi:helicase superfamily c-terminal domain [Schizosaccharomyces osmophilus]|uniref:DNA 3'-5' helicase n=1 Tax=Schizosaccharomyces osmophilus TaxID=2545709 RepID=A0AAF0AUK6_9SCHI|nr:helicase superfamily c-terminal domain [Schizosaccharomyces osmophilus]WBW71000.1 helicase superfamily c-terminal domain [Schizosaccharomyces osmophilus]